MRQSKLTEYSGKHKFSKSLISLKKNTFLYKIYYRLLDFTLFYKFKKTIKYSTMTLVSNIYDYSLIFIFTDIINLHYLVSGVIAYVSAVLVNYLLNRRYTFKFQPKNVLDAFYAFLRYFSVSFIGMILTLGIMTLLVEFLDINYMLSKLIASIIVLFYVYFAHSYVLKPKIKIKLPGIE